MIYAELFSGFLKVGLFAFGGAYGAIPLIRDVVLSYGWISDETLTYMIAISESTPGPIMVNLATYIGNTQAGFFGALTATAAVVLPSFLIILLVMILMKNLIKNKYVQAVLRGVKPCIIGIILATGLYMTVSACISLDTHTAVHIPELLITVLLAAVFFCTKYLFKKKMSPITLIIIAAAVGILVYNIFPAGNFMASAI